jgi:hypothetical protein
MGQAAFGGLRCHCCSSGRPLPLAAAAKAPVRVFLTMLKHQAHQALQHRHCVQQLEQRHLWPTRSRPAEPQRRGRCGGAGAPQDLCAQFFSRSLIGFGPSWIPAGIAGWRYLFLIEGLPAILAGLAVWAFLPPSPLTAPWLTPNQREALHEAVGLAGAGAIEGSSSCNDLVRAGRGRCQNSPGAVPSVLEPTPGCLHKPLIHCNAPAGPWAGRGWRRARPPRGP